MGKYKTKVSSALAARVKSYDVIPNKRGYAKPGSQNAKKGYGRGSGRR